MIYLDHAATTPLHPKARAAMLPFLDERFGNPSGLYAVGRDAQAAIDDARRRVVEEKVLKGKQPERALVRFGVTHVFIAPGDFTEYGVKAPEALEAYPQFRLRYCNDEGYRVYELLR